MSSFRISPIERLRTITKNFSSVQEGSRASANSPVRHKCFVSYHSDDADEVLDFVAANTDVFIPRAIGLEQDGSDIIDSDNVETIRQTIREKYLRDSSVTIVAIGGCTWARKFVDWEIYASLRDSPLNKQNGLLAVQMPSVSGTAPSLPNRLNINLSSDNTPVYARYIAYPSTETLRSYIEDAFNARKTRDDLLVLGGPLKQRNSSC